jgi:hypothetical protein
MERHPLTDNEEARLAALRNLHLLDTAPREQTPCHWALRSEGVTTVPDMLADERFGHTPIVRESSCCPRASCARGCGYSARISSRT